LKILLAGCGDIGQRLGEILALQHECFGLRRDIKKISGPITPLQANLTDRPQILSILNQEFDVIVATLTPDELTESGYRRAYIDTASSLAEVLKITPKMPRLVIWVSSTGVYGENHKWVDEESPTNPNTFSGNALLKAEQIISDLPCDTCVVRFSGIYGNKRTGILKSVLSGVGRPKFPLQWSNRIHFDDCVGTLKHLIERHASGFSLESIYIATDCEPVTQHELRKWISAQLKITLTEQPSGGPIRRRLSNKRLLDSGYVFKFPTFREGYKSLIADIIKNSPK
jgi:nucleoside-diphosphate-sugar epimerase